MSGSILELAGYSVSYGRKTVLASVDLVVLTRGVTVLMGPGGSGKSSLLRGLAGALADASGAHIGGTASYQGTPLGQAGQWPTLVAQKPRLVTSTVYNLLAESHPGRSGFTRRDLQGVLAAEAEGLGLSGLVERFEDDVLALPKELRRALVIFGASLANAPLLCVDEPTSDITGDEAGVVLDLLLGLSRSRAVLFVTHNQRHARAVASSVALLAGGVIQEQQPSDGFFNTPLTEAGRSWVRTGSCSVPSPDTPLEHLAPEFRGARPAKDDVTHEPPSATRHPARVVAAARGPNGFRWLQPGRLAGCPMPGVVHEADADLAALRRVGVTVLVTLTETPLSGRGVDPMTVGIDNVYFPVVDMEAPSIESAEGLCAQVHALKEGGEVVAFHCRAGIGRTGTMLAAQLIYEGAGAGEALATVRRVDRRWVQSRAQEEFLERFARHRACHRGPGATGAEQSPRGGAQAG